MDFMQALRFPMDDEDWIKKVGLGIIMQIIPFMLMGWSFEISKRVKNNDPTPLPDWSDFGGLFMKGLTLGAASILYQIPTIIFFCVIQFAAVLPAMAGGDEDALAALGGATAIIFACCGCLILVYSIMAGLTFMGGYVRYIDTEEFSTFMQFGDNFALVRENFGDFAMVILYNIGVGFLISIASSITLGLGSLVAGPVSSYFGGHILGQLASNLAGGSMDAAPAV